jgi:hypothetical protein
MLPSSGLAPLVSCRCVKRRGGRERRKGERGRDGVRRRRRRR